MQDGVEGVETENRGMRSQRKRDQEERRSACLFVHGKHERNIYCFHRRLVCMFVLLPIKLQKIDLYVFVALPNEPHVGEREVVQHGVKFFGQKRMSTSSYL